LSYRGSNSPGRKPRGPVAHGYLAWDGCGFGLQDGDSGLPRSAGRRFHDSPSETLAGGRSSSGGLARAAAPGRRPPGARVVPAVGGASRHGNNRNCRTVPAEPELSAAEPELVAAEPELGAAEPELVAAEPEWEWPNRSWLRPNRSGSGRTGVGCGRTGVGVAEPELVAAEPERQWPSRC
jgi:hypothetical protein